MITYQEIYDTLRKEKYNEQLQQLPASFLKEVAVYLGEKKEIVSRDQKNLFSDTLRTTRKQLDNTLSIIKEIILLREKKVLNLAFTAAMTGVSKRDTENLLKHEKELFDISIKQLEQNQHVLSEVLDGQIREEKDLKNLFVRFKLEVPAFLDANGNEIGPFKKGDIANLPKEVVQILLSDSKVATIDEEN